MIPDDTVERVRDHADIVAVIGEHVKLKRVGNSFRGPCPFHQGKDPNFSVSPRGGYHCFVCHEKGDIFSFVQKRLGLNFVEAVKYVGEKAGVEVKEVTRERDAGPDPREKFWEINAAAAEFFTTTLWQNDAGAPAREYLAGRKLDRETANRFGLGFAPRDPSLLRGHLNTLGFDDARQIEAGLLIVREEGDQPRPRFRNRLMFPIYDSQNRVIAFGGRVIGEGEPKYLNSAESPVFVKGATLYGLNWAKNALRRDDRALLVEGYFDCIRLIAAGIESTVAPLGTALTEPQAELIRKYTKTVFLLYDSDQAGLKATFRAGDVLLRQGMKVHVVTLPEGEDPDTFVQQQGRGQLEEQLAQAIDVFERKIQILQRGGWFSDLRRKRTALDRLLPTIRATADPIAFALYVSRTAEAAGIGQDVLKNELSAGQPDRSYPTDPAVQVKRKSQPVGRDPNETFFAEEWLLHLIIKYDRLLEPAAQRLSPNEFKDARFRAIYSRLIGRESDGDPLPEHAADVYEEIAAQRPMPNPQLVFEKCLSRIRIRDLSGDFDDLDDQIRLAGDVEKNEILTRQTTLLRELQDLGAQHWKAFRTTRR